VIILKLVVFNVLTLFSLLFVDLGFVLVVVHGRS